MIVKKQSTTLDPLDRFFKGLKLTPTIFLILWHSTLPVFFYKLNYIDSYVCIITKDLLKIKLTQRIIMVDWIFYISYMKPHFQLKYLEHLVSYF